MISTDIVSNITEEIKNTSVEDLKVFPPPRQKSKNVFKTSVEIKNLINQTETECEMKPEVNIVNNDISKDVTVMSATIVDILYKPNHNDIICSTSPKCTFLKENSFHSLITEDKLDPLVKYSPVFNVSVTDNNNVPKVSSSKKNKINVTLKDTEENDSGVYFSDTKSSPENMKPSWRNTCPEKYNIDSDTPGISIPSKCLRNSDSSDNNQTENLGPQSFIDNKFCQILDSFEAQTVCAFREDILNQFEVSESLYEKHQAVENWLHIGIHKSVKRNGLSEYLKCMLQTEESDDASSLQCLSAVEEDNRSDDNIGSKVAEETVKTINVYRDIDKNVDTTSIGDSQTVDFIVESNNNVFVNNLFVNNDVYNSQCLDRLDIIVDSVEDNVVCNESKMFETGCTDIYSNFSENLIESHLEAVSDDMYLSYDESNINIKALNSPRIEIGTVKSLINIFENIQYIENPFDEPEVSDEIKTKIPEYILPPPFSFLDDSEQTSPCEFNNGNFVESLIDIKSEDGLSFHEEKKNEDLLVICDNDKENFPVICDNDKEDLPVVCDNDKEDLPVVFYNDKEDIPVVCYNDKEDFPVVCFNDKKALPVTCNNKEESVYNEIQESQDFNGKGDFKTSEFQNPIKFCSNINRQNETKMPTKIPIVVLTQVNHPEDTYSRSPIGTIELHPCVEDSDEGKIIVFVYVIIIF